MDGRGALRPVHRKKRALVSAREECEAETHAGLICVERASGKEGGRGREKTRAGRSRCTSLVFLSPLSSRSPFRGRLAHPLQRVHHSSALAQQHVCRSASTLILSLVLSWRCALPSPHALASPLLSRIPLRRSCPAGDGVYVRRLPVGHAPQAARERGEEPALQGPVRARAEKAGREGRQGEAACIVKSRSVAARRSTRRFYYHTQEGGREREREREEERERKREGERGEVMGVALLSPLLSSLSLARSTCPPPPPL